MGNLLLVDLTAKTKKHKALFRAVNEYEEIKKKIKEFERKEKSLKTLIKDCGYKQVIFKSDQDLSILKIRCIESNIKKVNVNMLREILIDELKGKIEDISIIDKAIDFATETTSRVQVRLEFKRGK